MYHLTETSIRCQKKLKNMIQTLTSQSTKPKKLATELLGLKDVQTGMKNFETLSFSFNLYYSKT